MASQTYYVEIGNEYLGKYRRVTGRTRREVEMKVSEQILKWAQQEQGARERAAVADQKERARRETEEALDRIREYRSILAATLGVDDRVRWEDLKDREPLPEPPPTIEDVVASVGVPKRRPLVEKLRPSLAVRREEAERAARMAHERLVWTHEEAAEKHREEQEARNAEVAAFRRGYEAGDPEAVERYVSLVLANSAYPEGFPREFVVQYLPEERTVVVDTEIPSPDAVPRIVEHKYVASRRTTDEVLMKDRDFQAYYDGVVHQAILRTLHEIFEGDYREHCETAIVNG